jgi:hypothetical protein
MGETDARQVPATPMTSSPRSRAAFHAYFSICPNIYRMTSAIRRFRPPCPPAVHLVAPTAGPRLDSAHGAKDDVDEAEEADEADEVAPPPRQFPGPRAGALPIIIAHLIFRRLCGNGSTRPPECHVLSFNRLLEALGGFPFDYCQDRSTPVVFVILRIPGRARPRLSMPYLILPFMHFLCAAHTLKNILIIATPFGLGLQISSLCESIGARSHFFLRPFSSSIPRLRY